MKYKFRNDDENASIILTTRTDTCVFLSAIKLMQQNR